MISSEKPPPFLSEYQTSKLRAEEYLVENCSNLKPFIIRPGLVVDSSERSWSVPLSYAVDAMSTINESVVKKTPLSGPLDFLFPAHST